MCLRAGGVFTGCFDPMIDSCLDLVPSSVVNTPVCEKKLKTDSLLQNSGF